MINQKKSEIYIRFRRELNYLGSIMRKERLENITLTGHMRTREREWEKKSNIIYLTRVCKWENEEKMAVQKYKNLIKSTNNRKLWKFNMVHFLWRHSTKKTISSGWRCVKCRRNILSNVVTFCIASGINLIVSNATSCTLSIYFYLL